MITAFIITATIVIILAIITIYRVFRLITNAKIVEFHTPAEYGLVHNKHIKDLFQEVLHFMLSQRRTGTTTLIKNIAEYRDNTKVLAVSDYHARSFPELKGKVFTIYNLHKARATKPGPVLLDNYTVIHLLEEGLKGMEPQKTEKKMMFDDEISDETIRKIMFP